MNCFGVLLMQSPSLIWSLQNVSVCGMYSMSYHVSIVIGTFSSKAAGNHGPFKQLTICGSVSSVVLVY